MKLDTKAPLALNVQDTKKGKKRFVHTAYPYKGYIWNYECIPQPWEDLSQALMETFALRNCDSLDVCETGNHVCEAGEVTQAKALGVLGMIDEEEMDWSIIVITIDDPLADEMNDIDDLDCMVLGLLHATSSWLSTYEVPDGKDFNVSAFREQT